MIFAFEMVLAQVLFSLIGFDENAHKFNELLQYPMILIFILAVVIAPFFEELIFRGFLRYPNTIYGVVGFLLLSIVLGMMNMQFINLITTGIISFAIIVLLILVSTNTRIDVKIRALFKRYFGVVFYASVVLFAYAHIFNFTEIEAWYYTPILVLPQFILALFLGYVRVRNNLWTSIYVHALNNAIPTTLLLLNPELIG